MKILIVSGSYAPQISPRSFRTTELSKELSRQGHDVHVMIPRTAVDRAALVKPLSIDFQYIDVDRSEIEVKGTKIELLFRRVFRRALLLLFTYPSIKFYGAVSSALLSSKESYDLIISIAVPHQIHWGVERALRKRPNLCKRWIADCGDPFMLEPTDSFKKMFYFKFLEKSFCKRADFITIPIEEGKSGYYKEFHSKIRVIPQGFSFDCISLSEYKSHAVPTFGYAGGFIPGRRDPRPLVEYLCQKKIDFRFIVYTQQGDLFNSFFPELTGKLIIKSYVPRVELLEELSKLDFVINLENGTDVQSPSKLIDYALTKRPILSINSQNMDYSKIDEFLNKDHSRQLIVENLNRYDIRNVSNSFIVLYESGV